MRVRKNSGHWKQAADSRQLAVCSELSKLVLALCSVLVKMQGSAYRRASQSGQPQPSLRTSHQIMIFDFSNGGKGDFDDFAIRAFHFDAWSGERLGGFHAADDTPHALPIHRYNLHISFAVERLQGRKGFTDFHVYRLLRSSNPLPDELFLNFERYCTGNVAMSILHAAIVDPTL